MKPKTTYQGKFEAFKDAMSEMGENAKLAGQILCEMIEENENTFEYILLHCPSARLGVLESLEKIGRGKLDERLLLDSSPIAARAIAQAIPMKDQQRLISGYIPVAVRDNGGIRMENKAMSEINSREACMVIRDGKISTPEEQSDYLKEEAKSKASNRMRYIIEGDRITFLIARSTFKISELEDIVLKAKGTAIESLEEDMKSAQLTPATA